MRRLALVLMLVAACNGSSSSEDGANDGDTAGDDATDSSDDSSSDGDGRPVDAPASSVTCVGKTPQPRDATWNIGSRIAQVHVPASYQPGVRTPVILNIHGRTANAAGQASMSHAIAKSDAEGFILVHPQSATSPTAWNAGSCCDPATTNDVDDVGYIGALLDELEAKLCVDTDRVYAMGMSNGGYLSHTLGCKMADRIAAIGPVAGLLLESPCNPTRPVPAMLVNGTDDQLSLYQYVSQGVNFWVNHNHCTTESETFQNGDATCVTHGGCDGGGDVVLCTIDGGGHQWPGGEELPFLGHKSDNLITTDALWDFFVAHPKQ